jgi:hypothetical protein
MVDAKPFPLIAFKLTTAPLLPILALVNAALMAIYLSLGTVIRAPAAFSMYLIFNLAGSLLQLSLSQLLRATAAISVHISTGPYFPYRVTIAALK